MNRISVTTIEKFRRYMTDASPYDTEEALIETIKGIFTGNDKTKIGGAFHKILEGDYKTDGEKYMADDIVFTKLQVVPALDYRLQHPINIYETNARKVYETKYGLIQVTARIDVTEGIILRDSKTKFRAVNFKEYEASAQWKFYLDLLDASVMYYDVFEVKGFKNLTGKPPHRLLPNVQFVAQEPFQCIRYDGMEREVRCLLTEFLDYIHNRNFIHLLKPAIDESLVF